MFLVIPFALKAGFDIANRPLLYLLDDRDKSERNFESDFLDACSATTDQESNIVPCKIYWVSAFLCTFIAYYISNRLEVVMKYDLLGTEIDPVYSSLLSAPFLN